MGAFHLEYRSKNSTQKNCNNYKPQRYDSLELERLIDVAYEDRVKGKMPEDLCVRFIEKYTAEQKNLQAEIESIRRTLTESEQIKTDVDDFIVRIQKWLEINELTREMCYKLIDRVIVDRTYRAKVLSIFDQIPAFLSLHEKRVRLSNIEEGSSYPSYQDTFFWLGDSMIANECFNCADPNVGLSLNEERTSIKCYMGDTGLLVSHAFDENEIIEEQLYKQILHDKLSINEGMLFENAIAQNLVANGHKLFFYTHYNEEKHRNDIEIDFILSNNSRTKQKLYPIEVKSGKKYTTDSLNEFLKKFHQRIDKAYIIHTKNLTIKDEIVCIPSYMAILL